MDGVTRRQVLGTGVTAGAAGLAGCLNFFGGGTSTWDETYGDDAKETFFWNALPTSDGGFLATGSDQVEGFNRNALLVKFDGEGTAEWRETYGGSEWNWFNTAVETPDGYVICGTFWDDDGPRAWLMGVDEEGERVWEDTYREMSFTYGWGMIEANDTGFLLITKSSEQLRQIWTPVILKTDHGGDEEWREVLGSDDVATSEFSDATVADDGYLLTGRIVKQDEDAPSGYAVSMSDDGEVQWENTYDTGSLHQSVAVSNGYVIAGQRVGSDREDAWLLAIDDNGDERWSKTYPRDDSASFIDVTTRHGSGFLEGLLGGDDDGYLAVGWSSTAGTDDRTAWLVETDGDGEVGAEDEWDGDHSEAWVIEQTNDGGYVVVGNVDEDGRDVDDTKTQAKIVKIAGIDG